MSMTFKELALGGIRPGGQETFEITDEKGMTLPNPIMYLNGTRKWRIGIDPQTPSNQLEYTEFTEPGSLWPLIVLDPADHTQVYVQQATGYGSDVQVGNVYIRKYKWVPNGVATLVSDTLDV